MRDSEDFVIDVGALLAHIGTPESIDGRSRNDRPHPCP